MQPIAIESYSLDLYVFVPTLCDILACVMELVLCKIS